jgi:hypothetical protein
MKPYPPVDDLLCPVLRVAMPRAARLASVPLSEETLASRDCVCLAVAHRAFDHAMTWLLTHSRLLLDATGATRFVNGDQSQTIRLGNGTGTGD